MAKYRITDDGRFALEVRIIPPGTEIDIGDGEVDVTTREQRSIRRIERGSDVWVNEVQPWLDTGNEFDPEVLPEEVAEIEGTTEKQLLLAKLVGTDKVLLKLIIKIFQKLEADGAITAADIGAPLIAEAQELRQALADYEAL